MENARKLVPLPSPHYFLRRSGCSALTAILTLIAILKPQILAQFTDVSQFSGINPSASGERYTAIYNHGTAFVVDIDQDGWLDLFTTRLQGGNHLHRNNGDGTFTECADRYGLASMEAAHGAAFADFDNDGDTDLFISTLDHHRFYLYINQGSGQFAEEAIERGTALEVEDPLHRGYSVTVGDYDKDGWLDLHICEYFIGPQAIPPELHSTLLRNKGAAAPGHFENVTLEAGVSINEQGTQYVFASAFVDFDKDGHLDLTLTGDFNTSKYFRNQGDGTFENLTKTVGANKDQAGMGIAVGDYDKDLYPDFYVTSIFDNPGLPQPPGYTGNRLYRNNPNSSVFDELSSQLEIRNGGFGWGTAFFDADNDADLDLIATNGIFTYGPELPEPTRFWINQNAAFQEASEGFGITDQGNGYALLHWDYDNDGDQDILISQKRAPLILYRNDNADSNNWIRFAFQGFTSNRDGLGAKLTIYPKDDLAPQYFEYNPTNLFLAQSEPYQQVGLGPHIDAINRLVITWPSGIEQTLVNLPANRTYLLREPRSTQSGIEAFCIQSANALSAVRQQFIRLDSSNESYPLRRVPFDSQPLPRDEEEGLFISLPTPDHAVSRYAYQGRSLNSFATSLPASESTLIDFRVSGAIPATFQISSTNLSPDPFLNRAPSSSTSLKLYRIPGYGQKQLITESNSSTAGSTTLDSPDLEVALNPGSYSLQIENPIKDQQTPVEIKLSPSAP